MGGDTSVKIKCAEDRLKWSIAAKEGRIAPPHFFAFLSLDLITVRSIAGAMFH